MRRSLRRLKRASFTRDGMRSGKRALARALGKRWRFGNRPLARPAGRGRMPGSSRGHSGTIVPPRHHAQLLGAIPFVCERSLASSARTVREWDSPSDSEQREYGVVTRVAPRSGFPKRQPFPQARASARFPALYVQITHKPCVRLDEDAPRLDLIAHQRLEDQIGGHGVFHVHLEERAALGVHGGFPELLLVHLA